MKLPRGFTAAGVRAGIRKKDGLDVALIVAQEGASAAALFTTNQFQAAPVVLSRQALRASGGRVKAVVINAGCANAVTGKAGEEAARNVRKKAAQLAGCPEKEVFIASTGVIGTVLPAALLTAALPAAFEALSPTALEAIAQAILTTDSGPKVAQKTFSWNGKRATVTGIAKGAGMIHPNMATMLAFVMTDIPAIPALLRSVLKEAAAQSFNAISVDGDTSTNDTVLLLASGSLPGEPAGSIEEAASFVEAVTSVCKELAWKIVRDGEGAGRVMEITVTGARTAKEARLAAHAIATSPLVKTALSGGDPNWGRILAAAGRSGARVRVNKVSLWAGKVQLVRDGAPTAYKEEDAAREFAKERVPLVIDLGAGSTTATLLAADLGHAYVSLNADYRS